MHKCDTKISNASSSQRDSEFVIVHLNASRIGLVEAGEDLDQGGLATTVCAEKSVNLAGTDREVNTAQRGHSSKRLFETSNLKSVLPGGRAVRTPTVVIREF